MYTLPLPRFKWYEPSNYQVIQDTVTELTNELVTNLGFYEVRSYMPLLQTMKLSEVASLLLGLVFGVIIILFITISVLLIYSLLMISVETKTFETGVLRLVGMSKWNCISMILIQSMMFVLPSIVLGYIASIPSLAYVYSFLLKSQSEIQLSKVPTADATLQAVLLGLLIPMVSSILPV